MNLVGRVFGRLTVVSEVAKREGDPDRRWLCRCECGRDVTTKCRTLVAGHSRSCGCLQREVAAAHIRIVARKNRTHGLSYSPEWNAWSSMRARCGNPSDEAYHWYGGRGITVSQEWDTFEQFIADMGMRPSPKHSLGRVDNELGYSKENCRWETWTQQQRNRRSSRMLTLDGVTLCLTEWAEHADLFPSVLSARLAYGWPLDLAVSTPKGVRPRDLKIRRLPVDPLTRLKADAHNAVHDAVRDGTLLRPPCCSRPGCVSTRVQAHHHNGYERERWLDVEWLCLSHHAKETVRKRDAP